MCVKIYSRGFSMIFSLIFRVKCMLNRIKELAFYGEYFRLSVSLRDSSSRQSVVLEDRMLDPGSDSPFPS